MSFESKYLIRWGIPGWVFIFWISYLYLFLKDINPLDSKMVDISNGLTLLLSLSAVGVPIGYLLHQIYFSSAWVLNKSKDYEKIAAKVGKFPKRDWEKDKNQNYFHFEYVWHSLLIKQEPETQAYIEARYRHLLGTINALGALFISNAISAIFSTIIILTHLSDFPYNTYFWVGIILQILLFFVVGFNYKYYSDNLTAFQIKIMEEYLS